MFGVGADMQEAHIYIKKHEKPQKLHCVGGGGYCIITVFFTPPP